MRSKTKVSALMLMSIYIMGLCTLQIIQLIVFAGAQSIYSMQPIYIYYYILRMFLMVAIAVLIGVGLYIRKARKASLNVLLIAATLYLVSPLVLDISGFLAMDGITGVGWYTIVMRILEMIGLSGFPIVVLINRKSSIQSIENKADFEQTTPYQLVIVELCFLLANIAMQVLPLFSGSVQNVVGSPSYYLKIFILACCSIFAGILYVLFSNRMGLDTRNKKVAFGMSILLLVSSIILAYFWYHGSIGWLNMVKAICMTSAVPAFIVYTIFPQLDENFSTYLSE